MNGFTNAILTLLLGWLRSLFNTVWAVFGSDGNNSLLRLLSEHWKLIFLVLCVGGFIVDRIIYLVRWRPYYVWQDRRRARAHHNRWAQADDARYAVSEAPYAPNVQETYAPQVYEREDAEPEYRQPSSPDNTASSYAPAFQNEPFADTYRAPLADTHAYAADAANYSPPGNAYSRRPRASASPDDYAPRTPAPAAYTEEPVYPSGTQTRYAPDASFAPTVMRSAAPFYPPLETDAYADEPRFDEEPIHWDPPQSPYGAFAPSIAYNDNLAAGMTPAFGASQPEPAHYLQDVQAGFAPQPAPEDLYAKRPEPVPGAPNAPVHPGLDLETFQQNIGLSGTDALEDTPRRNQERYANFVPFAEGTQSDASDNRPRGLGALAKKARSFVSGEDERNPLSIRDLQSTVDVKSAFHAPVYPKKHPESEDE